MENSYMAAVVALGTATPDREVLMEAYARNYGDNMGLPPDQILLAERICSKAGIGRKYLAIPFERYSEESPNDFPRLNKRLAWYEEEAVGLAEKAARQAIEEWGGLLYEITHIIVYSTSGALSPGLDLRLIKRLGLSSSTKHFWVAFNGCHAGIMGLRTAAEIARGAGPATRVLVVWVEINSCQAQSSDPASSPANNIVVASIFGDGSAAAIVAHPSYSTSASSSPPIPHLFEVQDATSDYIDGPESAEAIVARVRETGLYAGLSKQVPELIEAHVDAFSSGMLEDMQLTYNSVNWIVHPGGRAIVDAVQNGCHLQDNQLELSRKILNDYSNMGAPTIIFTLKLLHAEHVKCRKSLEWVFALAFGPGISMEGMILRLP
ncbi:hypothetical protein KP509_20G002100 [Ceratopteris richardii]|uniref:Chalcone synthase n=1 Tax=Ceratopteris richardii TaxID=49495 RepID=A0A8T2SEB6_CERRI|nr:hypothetical protein KP509_20G002100 [Ceratopteris richardii]